MAAAAEPAIQEHVDALYQGHHRWLQGWLGRKLGNAGDAADLAQDVFVRLLCRQPCEVREPRTYLSAIAGMLDSLKPKVRTAFLWAQLEGLTCRQIGERMGVSLATAERYVAAALRQCYAMRFDV